MPRLKLFKNTKAILTISQPTNLPSGIAVKTYTTTESSQNVAGEFIDDLDRAELMRKVAGKALDGSDIDTIIKGGAGAAQDVNAVISNARKYGIKLSNKDALSYVANELNLGQGDMKKVNAKILAVAKSTYGNLADTLSDEVSLRDLSSNYIYNMAEVLELNPQDIDALDPTIQTALKNNGNKGTMNLTDFELNKVAAPNLPLPPGEYNRVYFDQMLNILNNSLTVFDRNKL